jgi:hypothetical protein
MDLNYSTKYKAGFLEEAASSGMCFINSPPNNPIAVIKLSGPADLLKQVHISNISITSDLNASIKFKCDVYSDDALLFRHIDFANATEELVGARMVHGLVFNAQECYLSYSVRLNQNYTTPSLESDALSAFYLSPFALEPYVGDVSNFAIDGQVINVQPLNSGNGRLVTFVEGNNYKLESLSNFEVPRFQLSAIAGEGAGREPCDDSTTGANIYLTGINGAAPNEAGELIISCKNDCLMIEPNYAAKELNISSHCAPCCRCSDYTNVGKFIRKYAALYAKMAKKYNELVGIYNSVRTQFGDQADCCSTYDKMNTRFKIWPQQNFMIQVQALIENNYKKAVCLCDTNLIVEVKTGSTELTATEDLGSGNSITHRIPANTPLILSPTPEASYIYFKNVNPGNQVTVTSPQRGVVAVSANLQSGDLPIASPCNENVESLPTNCMEPCDGYLMLTAGFTIADPTFRRIVHVLQKNAADSNTSFEGVSIPIKMSVAYNGSPPDDPCAGCVETRILPTDQGFTKNALIAPNRKSVNPCAPVRLRNITVEENSEGQRQYYANFPEDVSVAVGSGATLTITRQQFVDGNWGELSEQTVAIPTGDTNKILLVSGQDNQDTPITGTSEGAVGVAFTVTTTGQNMTTKCFPDPNDDTASETINVAPSSATFSIRL